jgi:fused signal recognition particle receptor
MKFFKRDEPAPAPAPDVPAAPQDAPRSSWLTRLRNGLGKTRSALSEGLASLFLGRKTLDDDLLEELETRLLLADVGVKTTREVLDALTRRVKRKELADADALYLALKEELTAVLAPSTKPLVIPESDKPFVILMVGVNGTGKTTSSAKLAYWLKNQGRTCLLVAADTFRAAAIEQLCRWGEKLGLEVMKSQYQGDSAALCYDAWDSANRRNIEFLLCDTAGRLHTKSNLMQELAKVSRTLGKHDPDAPHEKWIVLDATTGSNALVQAREFHNSIGLTGVILTKLDGSGKGGIAVAIQHELGLPTKVIGTGEKETDFAPFNRAEFVERLIS